MYHTGKPLQDKTQTVRFRSMVYEYLSISDCFQDYTTPSSLPLCEESLCGCHRFVSHVYRLKECIETCTLHPSHRSVTWKLYTVACDSLRPLHQNCIFSWPQGKWPASVTQPRRIPTWKTCDLACKIRATVASPLPHEQYEHNWMYTQRVAMLKDVDSRQSENPCRLLSL